MDDVTNKLNREIMTTKKKSKTPTKKDAKTLNVTAEKGKSEERKLTEVQLSPNTLNAMAVQTYAGAYAGKVDLAEAFTILQEKSKKINNGDLSELEATLAAQAVSLNAIFATMAKRADQCEFMNQMETTMKLAFRAQSQCSRTIEILASIKHPPMVYAQTNIAHGHQQVNNAPSHAGETINSQNELLQEDNHGMGTRAPTKTRRNDTQMETVGKIHGTQDGRR